MNVHILNKLTDKQLACLTILGKNGLTPLPLPENIYKAAKELPVHAPEALFLSKHLEKAWNKTGRTPTKNLESAIDDEDEKKLEKAKKELVGSGVNLVKEARPGILDFVEVAIQNAARSMGDYGPDLNDLKADRMAIHIEEFLLDFPRKVIQNNIDKIEKAEKSWWKRVWGGIKRFVTGKTYMQGVASFQSGRVRAITRIQVAAEQGYTHCQIRSKMDDRVCPVCRQLHGKTFELKPVYNRANAVLRLTNTDDIINTLPFPRMKGGHITNISGPGQLIPPFHIWCRCELDFIKRARRPGRQEGRPTIDLPDGYEQREEEDLIRLYPNKPFKNVTEVRQWLRDNNIAMTVAGTRDVKKINNMLTDIRTVAKHVPLRNRLEAIQIGGLEDPSAGGEFDGERIHINPKVFKSPYRTMEQLKKKELIPLQERLEFFKEMFSDVNKMKPGVEATQRELSVKKEILKDHIEKTEKAISKLKNATRSRPKDVYVIGDKVNYPSSGILLHEYGHAWHLQNDNAIARKFGIGYIWLEEDLDDKGNPIGWKDANRPAHIKRKERKFCDKYGRVSEYAEVDFEECIAENFSSYVIGEVDKMHPDMLRFLDEMIPTMDWGHKLRPEIYKRGKREKAKKNSRS